MNKTQYQVKRLNLRLSIEVDRKLREIADKTGLKMVTIISKGIEHEFAKLVELK